MTMLPRSGNTRYMTLSKPHSPVRAWRRGAAFKQKEIARLLGLRSISQLSRIEQGKRVPGLSLAIGLEVLTGMSLEEIIEPYYEAVEEETLARVTNMLMQLEASTHAASVLKVRHLRSCQDRVLTRIRNQ
ncbi:helix-turn-helix transcriptional regulator [Ramlibacter sp. RBP-2]|uniref:Helix-turn-helix transcriptional regulator n=2 Tax=Ramlibacter lithotrophicus TaxID=2606681 RepID=A0A7X6DGS4_9BURK|nr:helix-turn-helix transcriptional regulator [Ramlibacter lithotrophicus]